MQNQYSIINEIDNTSFDSLESDYTLTEEIKIVTTLQKGNYTIPNNHINGKKQVLELRFYS